MSYIVGSTYWLAQFLIAQGGMQLSTVSTIYSTSANSEEVQAETNPAKQTVVTS
jgi:hypothetical protein